MRTAAVVALLPESTALRAEARPEQLDRVSQLEADLGRARLELEATRTLLAMERKRHEEAMEQIRHAARTAHGVLAAAIEKDTRTAG